jgi:hypothetical protein
MGTQEIETMASKEAEFRARNIETRRQNPELAKLADAFLLRIGNLLALPPHANPQVAGTVISESPDEKESGKGQN